MRRAITDEEAMMPIARLAVLLILLVLLLMLLPHFVLRWW
jgi:hypothetical protein